MPTVGLGVSSVVQRLSDPGCTLDLHGVHRGDIITVILKRPSRKTVLRIRVIKPAGPGWGQDSLKGVLLSGSSMSGLTAKKLRDQGFAMPPIGVKIFVTGSYTYNPGAPLGMSMLTVHRVTIGRGLLWYVTKGSQEYSYLSPRCVTTIQVRPHRPR